MCRWRRRDYSSLLMSSRGTPARYGTPHLVDETLTQLNLEEVNAGDVSASAFTPATRIAATRWATRCEHAAPCGVWRHPASLYPTRPEHTVGPCGRQGDGELMCADGARALRRGNPMPVYDGGRIPGASLRQGRWDLLPEGGYMWPRADRSRLPEALLLLLGVAHGRTAAARAHGQRRR
jgi:hypothetical protein